MAVVGTSIDWSLVWMHAPSVLVMPGALMHLIYEAIADSRSGICCMLGNTTVLHDLEV